MGNNYPIIFVHGLLGFGPKELGSLKYWGSAFDIESPLPRHEASVGPLSSAHDRACELAAQIKGVRVDYGEHHANEAGHNRFGADFSGAGFVPQWSKENPIHLVGHSLGSPTIRCLQHLLAVDYWGWGSDHHWVASISTISGVSNGSTLTYLFGADEKTGLLDPEKMGLPFLKLIENIAAVVVGNMDDFYDFDLAHWGFVRDSDESFRDYLDRLSQSPFLFGKDNAAYSLSLQGAYEDNEVWETHSDTYYFSYVTEQTSEGPISGHHHPELKMNLAMRPFSNYIGDKVFTEPPIPIPNFQSSDWWENDGLVPTYSQIYPHINGRHPVGGEFSSEHRPDHFQPGKWYYKWERGMDHLDICVFPQLFQRDRQEQFYIDLFKRLAGLTI
jgi:triacylglycerol esterase/lipase EstA (alpha/beta hydrolase family)